MVAESIRHKWVNVQESDQKIANIVFIVKRWQNIYQLCPVILNAFSMFMYDKKKKKKKKTLSKWLHLPILQWEAALADSCIPNISKIVKKVPREPRITSRGSITKTRLYNFDPLQPHFYIVKLGFTGVYIIFLISAQKHRLWVLVRTASVRRF